jgi:hypothetical protein
VSRKRNWQKIEREQAEKEKSQSVERQRTIADLSRALEELESSNKQPGEGLLVVARELAGRSKINKRPLFEGLWENKRLLILGALVVALREDYELLQELRQRFSNDFENLIFWNEHAKLRELASVLSSRSPPLTSDQRYERKRWRYNWRGGVGLIEYQFGGAEEAERRKQPLAGLFGSAYQPTCLDDIFAGGAVKMHYSEGEMSFLLRPHRLLKPGLQSLFGMDRHRFPKKPRNIRDRETFYDYRAVVIIMDSLLTEKPRKKRRKSKPGRPSRTPWLDDPALRTRVLTGIKGRINSLADRVPKHIKSRFLSVIRRHLPDSGKK